MNGQSNDELSKTEKLVIFLIVVAVYEIFLYLLG